MGKTEENKKRMSSKSSNRSMVINLAINKVPIEFSLRAHPSIRVNGFTVFSGSDLDNTLMLKDMKMGVLPKHVAKAIAEEVGTSTEKVLEIYADAVSKIETDKVTGDITTGVSKTTHTGTLDPISWFTDGENPTFKPFLCAKDYLTVYPDVISEYSGLIHQFTGKYWLKDAEGTIASNIEKAGTGIIKPRQIQEALESLRNLTRIIDPSKLSLSMEEIMPMPPHSIPIENGILNLLDKTIQPFSPDFYYTEVLPRNYLPGAVPEVFLQFLDKIFTGDPDAALKITQIFEIIGWTLMMNYDIQGAVVLYGQGGEGKSIVHNIIADTIVHTTSISLSELEQDRFKRAELSGSWANLISESSSNIVISDWFKRLTDGTTITAERKNQRPFQFASHAKLILDVNELPVEEGQLRAFYRRVPLIIDFHNMLEEVLNPQEIDKFVRKLKDPAELDQIFSYVVDCYYNPLVSRMKFTGHLNLAEAEAKWQERSNPALSFLQAKHTNGDILNDTEDVKAVLDLTLLSRYITTEKDGTEYLTMVKQDVVNAAQQWAVKRGFPAKTINGGSLGKALVSLGFPNETVNKRINATTFLKAWKNIFIDLRDEIDSIHVTGVTGRETPPSRPQTQSNADENRLCDGGRFLRSVSFSKNKIREEDRENIRHLNSKTLGNTEENPVTGDSGHPSRDRHTTSGAYDSESSADIAQTNIQSETGNDVSSFTLENGSTNMDLKNSPKMRDSEHVAVSTANPLNSGVQSQEYSITEENGRMIIDQLLSLGYHIDPDSGRNIDRKYYKIGVLGLRSLSADMRGKLENIMHQEGFTLSNSGSMGIFWYIRPLIDGTKEGPHVH